MDDVPYANRRPAVHGERLLAEGARIDRWEEGFDSWTPRAERAASDDTDFDLEREELLGLARRLAADREAEHDRARTELEQLKQELRGRAEAVAARERELAELQRRLDEGKSPKPSRRERRDDEAMA